jgi:hypothetical protein
MCFQSQVFEPLQRHTLDTSVIKCYGDVAMGRGTRITTWHRISEGNHYVLMYSYRNSGAVWPTVAKFAHQQNHTCLLNTINLSNIKMFSKFFCYLTLMQVFRLMSSLLLTHVNTAVPWVMAAHSAQISSWSSSMLCSWLLYTMDFRWPQRKKSSDVRSGERGGHSTSPLWPIHHPSNYWFNHWRATVLKWGGAPSCWK